MTKGECMKAKFLSAIKTILSNGQLRVGFINLSILILVALFTHQIAGDTPKQIFKDITAAPGTNGHILGTDGLGRDLFTLIIYGSGTSLKIGFVAASIAGILGTLIGGTAGYFGGGYDRLISEIINIFLMTPTFFLILIVVALFGSSILNVMIVIGLTSWTGNARLMRAQAISIKQRTYVASAKAIGEKNWTILFKHVIPNSIFPIIANTTMIISSSILIEAGLSFLGLGDPNVISWGQIIYSGKNYLPKAWWICTFSGIAIVYAVYTFFLIGDGLNRVLSPKLKTLEK